uniref:GB1/RHD3-type G domain-containing protein n=1 Tax=Strigamia maritima TaxID=126957 RepID=T1IGX7_STRMM
MDAEQISAVQTLPLAVELNEDSRTQRRDKLIVSIDETTGKIDLKTEVLKGILTQKKVKNLKVAIIGIAGPFRKGKSFLLSFFIRYFKLKRHPDWLKEEMDKPLDGFRWSRGAASVTKGIWMWSKPLIKGDVAIFLMDVQGSFDAKQSEQANTNVLAWSTMISTVTIFNLMSDLQMNYLDNLNYCTEYARIAVRNKNENPFQKLIFLIRDWERISSHVHGFGGGMAYLSTWLTDDNNEDQNPTAMKIKILLIRMKNQNPTHKNERPKILTRNNGNTQQPPETNNIQIYWKQLQCFLMPHPGVKAWLMGNFKGEPKFIEPYFLEYLDMFVPNVVNNIKVNTLL